LWSLLNILYPDRFSSYWFFFHRYVEAYEGWFGPIATGPKNTNELAEVLRTIRIRRTFPIEGFEMPEVIESDIYVRLEDAHMKAYEDMRKSGMVGEFSYKDGVTLFSHLQRMVNLPHSFGWPDWQPKTETVVNLVIDALNRDEKVVVFGYHREYMKLLYNRLINENRPNLDVDDKKVRKISSVLMTGDVNVDVRQRGIDSIKYGDGVDVVVATVSSMGVGVDLPEVSTVITVEDHWSPAVINQAIGRVKRIGQLRPIKIFNIRAKDTIDEYIKYVREGKEGVLDEENRVFNLHQMMLRKDMV